MVGEVCGLCVRLYVHFLFWFMCVRQPGEGECRSAKVITKYSLRLSHHWSRSSETAVLITAECDEDTSKRRVLAQEMACVEIYFISSLFFLYFYRLYKLLPDIFKIDLL